MTKKRIIFLFILLWGILLAASMAKKRLFKSPPPGTVALTDSLYIDKMPVRTIDYLEFLAAIRNSYSPRMHDSIAKLPSYGLDISTVHEMQSKMKWDSLYYVRMLTRTWITYANDIKKYDVDYRLKNPKYYNYPIVNISYVQITEYCKWRTDMVKIHYALISSTEKQRQKYPLNLEYRLPTKKEWDKAMGRFFSDIVKLDKLTTRNSNYLNNVASIYEQKKNFQYNSNNVAEMLDRFIITTGFTWDEEYDIGNVSYVKYQEPSDWAGFRCVCEILPKKGRKKKETGKVKRDKYGQIIAKKDYSKKKKESYNELAEEKAKRLKKEPKRKKTRKSKMKTETVAKKRRKRK